MKGSWKYLKSWSGDLASPTHDFKLLKEHRRKQFEKRKNDFISERKSNETQTLSSDIDLLYLKWLKEVEAKSIVEWFSKFTPSGEMKSKKTDSDLIELEKYEEFVKDEIARIEGVLKTKNKSSTSIEHISSKSFQLRKGTIKKGTYKDILNVLIEGALIGEKTTLPNFTKIFSGKDTKNKIEWVGSIPSLHEFISLVWKFNENRRGIWITTTNHFTHVNGLDQTKLQNSKGAKSKDKETIRKALKYFTTT